MKKILFIGGLFLYSLSFAQAKNEKIRELLSLTGAGNLGATYAKQILTHFKSVYPSVPEKVWIDFSNEIKASDLEDLILPLYQKYYTEKDIDDYYLLQNTCWNQNYKNITSNYARKPRSWKAMGN